MVQRVKSNISRLRTFKCGVYVPIFHHQNTQKWNHKGDCGYRLGMILQVSYDIRNHLLEINLRLDLSTAILMNFFSNIREKENSWKRVSH